MSRMSDTEVKEEPQKCSHCAKEDPNYGLHECELCGDIVCGDCSLLITAYRKDNGGYPAGTIVVCSGTLSTWWASSNISANSSNAQSQQKPDMIICKTCGDKLNLALRVAAAGDKEDA